jgi:hypothetical protein
METKAKILMSLLAVVQFITCCLFFSAVMYSIPDKWYSVAEFVISVVSLGVSLLICVGINVKLWGNFRWK